jgi:hypothetical protein
VRREEGLVMIERMFLLLGIGGVFVSGILVGVEAYAPATLVLSLSLLTILFVLMPEPQGPRPP